MCLLRVFPLTIPQRLVSKSSRSFAHSISGFMRVQPTTGPTQVSVRILFYLSIVPNSFVADNGSCGMVVARMKWHHIVSWTSFADQFLTARVCSVSTLGPQASRLGEPIGWLSTSLLLPHRFTVSPAAPPDKACSPGTGPDLAEDKDGAEMGEVEVKVKTEEFLATGRTGRRNALPDISDELAAYTSTGDLPLDMAKLSCAEGGQGEASGCGQPAASSASSDSKPS